MNGIEWIVDHGGGILASLTVAGLLWRGLSAPIFAILAGDKKKRKDIKQLKKGMSFVLKQIQTNDGSSIKDQLKRIEDDGKEQLSVIKKNTTRIDSLETGHGTLLKNQEKIMTFLETDGPAKRGKKKDKKNRDG